MTSFDRSNSYFKGKIVRGNLAHHSHEDLTRRTYLYAKCPHHNTALPSTANS